MSSICFCNCTIAASFVVSDSRHTRNFFRKGYLCKLSDQTALEFFLSKRRLLRLYLFSWASSLESAEARSLRAAALLGTHALLWTPWLDLSNEAESTWTLAIYPSPSLSLSICPSHTLPLIPQKMEKLCSLKVLFVGITVQPQKPLRMACVHFFWLQTLHVEVEG